MCGVAGGSGRRFLAVIPLSHRCLPLIGLRLTKNKYTAACSKKAFRGVNMEKSKVLQASRAAQSTRAALKPARIADAQLDHLEHMIRSLAVAGNQKAFACLDRAYWKRRLAALGDESDLVSTQRARVLRLFDLLAQDHAAGPDKAAA